MIKVEVQEITNNLDRIRVPLNSIQRAEKETNPIYPYIGANNIMGYIDEYLFDEKILCVAEDGGSWGYQQTCAKIYNEKVWVNNHAHVLTAKDNLILEYLMYYLNYADLTLYINGATRGKLTKSSLNGIKIPLPPLEQQKKIASILDAADACRQKTKALIKKYDELTQSLFLDMFGDPVRNPKGWEVKPLKDFGKIVTGNTPSRRNEDYYSTNFIEWIKTGNITSENQYITNAEEYLSKEGLKNGRFVNEGSLLVACIAGSIQSIGRAALTDRKVAFNQQINAIEPHIEVSSLFLYHLFRNSLRYIQDHATHGMKRMLSKGDFQKILMIKPPIELQNQFAERVQAIEAQKAQVKSSLAHAEDLFNSLLQRAFKGELTS